MQQRFPKPHSAKTMMALALATWLGACGLDPLASSSSGNSTSTANSEPLPNQALSVASANIDESNALGGNAGVSTSGTATTAEDVLALDEKRTRRNIVAPSSVPEGATPATSTPTTTPTTTPTATRTAAPAASPAPTPAPAPAPKPPASAASGKINSVETILADMSRPNDVQLAGVNQSAGWASSGQVIMGSDSRGTHTPSWWTPGNAYYKSGAYWNAVLPWFVLFDGVGNGASNTRVQFRDMKIFVKSRRSGQWTLVGADRTVGGNLYPKSLQGEQTAPPNVRQESDGSLAVLPPSGNLVYHGWCCGKKAIQGSDVAALFVTVQARLAVDNAGRGDDRGRARYLVNVGADYYPDVNTGIDAFAPTYWNPGVGVSRAKLVTNEWQSFNFATVDVARQDPGGGVISSGELRAAPPPLD